MVDVCKPDVWTGVGVGRQPLPYRTMEELPVTRPNSRFPRLPRLQSDGEHGSPVHLVLIAFVSSVRAEGDSVGSELTRNRPSPATAYWKSAMCGAVIRV